MRANKQYVKNLNLVCTKCGNTYGETLFNKSYSSLFPSYGDRMIICKNCLKKVYNEFLQKYRNPELDEEFDDEKAEKKAIRRMCMLYDIYYSDTLFEYAKNSKERAKEKGKDVDLITSYVNQSNLKSFRNKTYEDTLEEYNDLDIMHSDESENDDEISEKWIKFFGDGMNKADYQFLIHEYLDWTTRHECQTKAQEEVFKRISFNQLKHHKKILAGEDTKDEDATLQKLLDTGNLKPKQNSLESMSDAQTFGLLLNKFEDTRPLPEIDPALKDVDHIGQYIDVFYRGHSSKMLGLEQNYSQLYDDYMKQYTVTKPEYSDDENSEALFNAIFGNIEEENEQ